MLKRNELIAAIHANQTLFDLSLPDEAVQRLADYHELILEHNPILHLVGPCSPEEFAVRHILESLSLLEHLPQNAKFADVGAGAGLPSLPCLIVREDLKAILIESKEKKTKFLETAISQLGLVDRATVVNRQFEETDPCDAEFVTSRALDRFTEKLPKLVKWTKGRKLLLFGGKNLAEGLQANGVWFVQKLMPMSEQRYLFVSDGNQDTHLTSKRG